MNGLILYIFRLYWYTLPRTKTVYYRSNVIWAFSQKEAGWIIKRWKCQCPQRVNITEMLVNRGVDFQLFQLKIAALHSLTVASLLTAVSWSYCSDKTLHFLLPRDARGKGNFTFMTRSEDKIREPYCSAGLYQHFLCLWILMFTFCSCPHFSNYFEEAVPAPHLSLYPPIKQLHTVRLDSCPAQLHLLYCELKQNSFTCFCTRTLQGWFSCFVFCFVF